MAHTMIGSIQVNSKSLSNTDKKIADFIIGNAGMVTNLTIKGLAAATGVSTASISRFVKRIGFDSYRDFSMDLVATKNEQSHQTVFAEISAEDSLMDITQKTFQSSINALEATQSIINEQDLGRAVIRILNAKVLNFFGLGGSSEVALDGYHKFVRTSVNCAYHPDFDIQLMQAAKLTEKDCAILVSHSGENRETLQVADILAHNHVPMIVITSFGNSALAQIADIAFISVAEEVNYRSEGMYSLIAQLAMMDSLFMMTAVRLGNQTEATMKKVRQVIEDTRHD